jgi:hypothetical protein
MGIYAGSEIRNGHSGRPLQNGEISKCYWVFYSSILDSTFNKE